ncbi:MAG: putative aminohydrolase SsnA [Deltaproteobacteria bacterium]|nr:putative aminohydrolase SsnA [Deltaproteobacteria bacterium]
MTDLLITNAVLLRPGSTPAVQAPGALLVRGEEIAWVGPADMAPVPGAGTEVLDARGRVCMPGLINAHHHLYSTFACGLAAPPSGDFPAVLRNLWWRLDSALSLEAVHASALPPLARCILAGTTTILDHHASPRAVRGSLEALAAAVRQAGIRAALCYEVSDRDGPAVAAAGIEENVAWIEACRSVPDGRLAPLFGLHAAFTVGNGTLTRAVAEARRLGAGIHVHVAEDRSDQEHSLATYGTRVVNRLADAGALGDGSVAAHCVHVGAHERRLLAETGTLVVHNPSSNMNNGVGAADLRALLDAGCRVGLGTDGMRGDMLAEASYALVLQHHRAGDPSAAFPEPLDALLLTNAAFASRLFGRRLGVLEAGAAADLILVDHLPATPLHDGNLHGHLYFGVTGARVTHTMVAGRFLMRDGRLLTLDPDAIAREALPASRAAWSRF